MPISLWHRPHKRQKHLGQTLEFSLDRKTVGFVVVVVVVVVFSLKIVSKSGEKRKTSFTFSAFIIAPLLPQSFDHSRTCSWPKQKYGFAVYKFLDIDQIWDDWEMVRAMGNGDVGVYSFPVIWDKKKIPDCSIGDLNPWFWPKVCIFFFHSSAMDNSGWRSRQKTSLG